LEKKYHKNSKRKKLKQSRRVPPKGKIAEEHEYNLRTSELELGRPISEKAGRKESRAANRSITVWGDGLGSGRKRKNNMWGYTLPVGSREGISMPAHMLRPVNALEKN